MCWHPLTMHGCIHRLHRSAPLVPTYCFYVSQPIFHDAASQEGVRRSIVTEAYPLIGPIRLSQRVATSSSRCRFARTKKWVDLIVFNIRLFPLSTTRAYSVRHLYAKRRGAVSPCSFPVPYQMEILSGYILIQALSVLHMHMIYCFSVSIGGILYICRCFVPREWLTWYITW